MIRTGRRYEPSEVIPKASHIKGTVGDFDGHTVKLWSQRYRTFRKSLVCAHCGIIGQYMVLERHPEVSRYHFNLYAVDEAGREVLMTKDHIRSMKRGGSNRIENLQTMCLPCNSKKGSS